MSKQFWSRYISSLLEAVWTVASGGNQRYQRHSNSQLLYKVAETVHASETSVDFHETTPSSRNNVKALVLEGWFQEGWLLPTW